VLPGGFRQWLRGLHRGFVFRRALRRFRGLPDLAAVDRATVARLSYGWGNESWSAGFEYLRRCLGVVAEAGGPVLECGSGLSTVLVGLAAQRRGLELWSFEHIPAWRERVQAEVARQRLDNVRLCLTPLRDRGEFAWYEPPDGLPSRFEVVVCDGPPGDTKGGRYGLWPVLRDRIAPGAQALLDDAGRPEETAILRRWAAETGGTFAIEGDEKPFGVFQLPSGP
jgi:hypothetical protein